MMSPKMGRPLSSNPKTESFHIRVTPDEKEKIMKFSKDSGYTLLELIRIGIEMVKKR